MEPPSEQRKLKDIVKELGESSSLHGIPRIITSRQKAVKVLWFLLLIAASALFGYQMHGLIKQYYSYPVKTSVSLHFARLRLPAVTLCNMNPIKQSVVKNLNGTPNTTANKNDPDHSDSDRPDDSDIHDDLANLLNNAPLNPYGVPQLPEDEQPNTPFPPTGPAFSATSKDEYTQWKQEILAMIKHQSLEERKKFGHQRDEFILKATFRGFQLNRYNCMQRLQTTNYGNCFTIDSPDFVARTSGPGDGLELILNLDIDEYAKFLTSGFGVRLVIHESGTAPMPDVEGLTLNPGFETNVGIKLTHLHRLGGLYGECNDGVDFYKQTGVQYTVPLCQTRCSVQLVSQGCKCIPIDTPDFFDYARTYHVCITQEHEKCMNKVMVKMGNSNSCNCTRKCSENSYTTTLSSRAWPSPSYLQNILLNETCAILNSSNTSLAVCEDFTSGQLFIRKNYTTYANNFVKINIYYEDLNYAQIIEEPLYDTLRFLSDIGGAMGLYMGASLLTYVEILQLLLEVAIYIRKRIALKMQHSTVNVSMIKVNCK